MGNWRTVNIVGPMNPADADALRTHLGYPGYWKDVDNDPAWQRFGPLSFCKDQPSLCGVNDWPAVAMDRAGNLAERDYDPEDVAATLRDLLAVAPSMDLKVHCGGEWESLECVATATVHEGAVTVGPPEIPELKAMSDEQGQLNMLRAIAVPRF